MKVIVRLCARGNNGILGSNYPALDTNDTENDLELKKEVEERKLHRMAMVHRFLEMWQGSQNLRGRQKASRTEQKQMTDVGDISDTEEIIKASWLIIHQDGAAAFKLAEWSALRPALAAKYLPGGRTQVLNVCRIETIDCRPAKSDEESEPEYISDTQYCLDGNSESENSNMRDVDWEADDESNFELLNGIVASSIAEHCDVYAAPNVSR